MSNPDQWDNPIGQTAVDANGDKIGKVGRSTSTMPRASPSGSPSKPACSAGGRASPRCQTRDRTTTAVSEPG